MLIPVWWDAWFDANNLGKHEKTVSDSKEPEITQCEPFFSFLSLEYFPVSLHFRITWIFQPVYSFSSYLLTYSFIDCLFNEYFKAVTIS